MLRRRSVLAGLASMTTFAAAVPFAKLVAATTGPRIRYDATSQDGKAMLKIYAAGVEKMKKADVRDPLSWTFQWYIHFVAGNTNKQKAIPAVFGPDPSKGKTLAQTLWSTCQAHSGGMESNFLPWHRGYVYFFESIVRSLTTNDFTLPYWDYTTNAVVPEEFRRPNSASNPLYVGKRNPPANNGQPIGGSNAINLDSLKQTSFLPQGVALGFNQDLDATLHGAVHVLTGNSQNMGSVPWAADDPIFWMHHCNIDRIWAAWNAYGGVNPTDEDWLTQSHAFVDAASKEMIVTNAEMTSIDKLGYRYETLPPRQQIVAARVTERQTSMAAAPPPVALASLDRAITLGAGSTRVQLSPSATLTSRGPEISEPRRRTYLVVDDIHTNVQPGILYSIYATGQTKTFLGAIQFFDAKPEGVQSNRRFVFDITDKIRAAGATAPLSYEIVPEGKPVESAKPLVGSIRVLQE